MNDKIKETVNIDELENANGGTTIGTTSMLPDTAAKKTLYHCGDVGNTRAKKKPLVKCTNSTLGLKNS